MTEIILAIINQIAPILGAVAACGAVYVSLQNRRETKQVSKTIDEVKAAATVQKDEIDLMKTGAFRLGHEAGVQTERVRSGSQPAPLSND